MVIYTLPVLVGFAGSCSKDVMLREVILVTINKWIFFFLQDPLIVELHNINEWNIGIEITRSVAVFQIC